MKKSFLIVIMAGLLFTACKDHSQKSNNEFDEVKSYVEYYSSLPLRESPYPDFVGIVQISIKEASNRNHYQFKYDETGKLKEVTFRFGETIIYNNHTSNYFFQTPIQRFEYDGNKEIRTFYDRNGNQVSVRGVFREIYVKDDRGKKVELYFEDDAGNRIENSWNIAWYDWKIQSDGSVIENRFNIDGEPQSLRPSFPFYRIRLAYEQNGFLGVMQNIDQEGNLVENETGAAQDKLEFDAEGRWYGWNVLDKDGKLEKGNGPNVARGINTPNKWGYEAALRFEDEIGNPVKNNYGFWGSNRVYDEFGNYDYTNFVDAEGDPAPNENAGYTYADYTFAQNHIDRILVQLLDSNRQPILHSQRGYNQIKQDYDANHNLIKTSYLNAHGILLNRLDNGIAYIIYEYDDKMKRTGSIAYDKDGKKLNL